ncbi:hypothetical protein [Brevibacillus sp. 179-C9.3 HS]
MKKARDNHRLRIESVSYIHDPEAAKQWFDLYVEIMKEGLLKKTIKKT